MGRFANPRWLKLAGWTIATAIIALNLTLLSYLAGI
jgi:Mn2+/Fe2+ NRAMP family transporter